MTLLHNVPKELAINLSANQKLAIMAILKHYPNTYRFRIRKGTLEIGDPVYTTYVVSSYWLSMAKKYGFTADMFDSTRHLKGGTV